MGMPESQKKSPPDGELFSGIGNGVYENLFSAETQTILHGPLRLQMIDEINGKANDGHRSYESEK